MSSSVILVYGSDPRLLETRAWVLEIGGHRVLRAGTLPEAEAVAEVEPVDVAVLCHTLAAQESRAALRRLRELRPAICRLVLTVNGTEVTEGQQEAVLSIYDGPQRLLDEVSRLLCESDARE